jgi:hypothetical protein
MTKIKPEPVAELPPTAVVLRRKRGRRIGSTSPVDIERVRQERGHIIAAVLRGATAGDAGCARICLELIGDLPTFTEEEEEEYAEPEVTP